MTVRVKLNIAGFRQLRTAPDVVDDLERRAQAIAAAAGPGHKVSTEAGRTRAIGMVWTDTPEAMLAEATGRSLTRAIDAGKR